MLRYEYASVRRLRDLTTNTTDGMHVQHTYYSNNALLTVKLRDPSSGDWNYQRKTAFTLNTSGSRRRYVKTPETRHPDETTTDTGGGAVTGDALSVVGAWRGNVRGKRQAAPSGSFMISGGRRYGISSVQEYRGPSRCRSPGTRPSPSTGATRS